MSADYPWYELCSGNRLEQGDFLTDCPVVIPVRAQELIAHAQNPDIRPQVIVEYYDLIVLTQTCDLDNIKTVGSVTCCARLGWTQYRREVLPADIGSNKLSSFMSELRTSRKYGLHLLNEWPEQGLDFQVVDFRTVFTLPLEYVQYLAQRAPQRIRLRSPYREHLAHSFAQVYARVALPVDITNFR